MRQLLALFAVSLGTAGLVYGELGDAPELMLLGLVLVAAAVAFGVWTLRRGLAS